MLILIHTSVKLVTGRRPAYRAGHQNFNPHEREARDGKSHIIAGLCKILIHTSVKLVTFQALATLGCHVILIHTSVKLVTRSTICSRFSFVILIHTSVKLVTQCSCARRRMRAF